MNNCPICLEKCNKILKLDCSHQFCRECIEKWKEKKMHCPLCRSIIFPNIIKSTRNNIYEKDAKEIITSKSSKGFSRFEVSSDYLLIDIDEGEEALEEAEETIQSKGYGYEVWFSGCKGFHLLLSHQMVSSIHLPYSHKVFVESLGINADDIYNHSRLVSLPGRVHPKTGLKKKLIKRVKGCKLSLEVIEKPDIKFDFSSVTNTDELASGFNRVSNMIVKPPKIGGRHVAIWGTSKDLYEGGLPYDVIVEIMIKVNDSWKNPKEEEEVLAAVEQGCK